MLYGGNYTVFGHLEMNKIAMKSRYKITPDKMVSCKEQEDNEKISLVINVGSSARPHYLKILPAYHQCGTTLL